MEPRVLPASAAGAPETMTAERCRIAELLNHPASPGASLARAAVAPGVVTALHAVEADERYIVLSGEGVVEIAGRRTRLGPGDCALIPAGAPQRIENTGAEELVFLCLCTPRFRPELYRDLESP